MLEPHYVGSYRSKAGLVLRWLAVALAILAASQTAIHLGTPRLPLSDATRAMARTFLVQKQNRSDFDLLAEHEVWRGKPLKSLLEHVELASYNRELVDWQLSDAIYREHVLSPEIDPALDGTMHWRRALWESLYPRIRREHDVEAAAQIVARHLRERVTIASVENPPVDVAHIWRRQIASPAGFEALYVAALRSVGIPARLNGDGRAEIQVESSWKPAPRTVFGGASAAAGARY